MESYDEVISLLKGIDVYSLLDQVFKNSQIQQTMIEFNQDQLQAGEDALGQKINTIGGSPYRAYTVKVRKKLGLQTNNVDLFLTGKFYKTFKVVITNQGYEITVNFDKEDGSILDNFSNQFDFLGLQKDAQIELAIDYVYNMLYNLLRKQLGL